MLTFGVLFWLLMILWFISWCGVRFGGLVGPYLYANEYCFSFCCFC
jgi:hypothetical protein